MGLKLSRKIRTIRDSILLKLKIHFNRLYLILIFLGGLLKFLYKKNKKKVTKKYSSNLNQINEYEFKKTSQNNEDGIIEYIFKKLEITNCNFIEIGFDYYENNSLNILKNANKGIYVDGSEEKVFILRNILKLLYPKKNIKIINDLVDKNKINQIIETHFQNLDIDFLSIDVDGIDYYIFENLKFNPKIICIEYNFWFGKKIKCSVPYDDKFVWEMGSLYSGSSLSALNSLAKSKGYYLVALDSACVNAFFVREDFRKHFEILDPKKDYKIPDKYSQEEVEIARENLLKKNLVYF